MTPSCLQCRVAAALLIAFAIAAPLLAPAGGNAQAMDLYVATHGRPDNLGTETSPLTFEDAMAEVSRRVQSDGVPPGGVTVHVAGGRYRFTQPVVLGREFAGTPDRPIVIRAAGDAPVVFDGARPISPAGFAPVTDPDERARLAASAVDQVRVKTIEDPILVARLESELLLTLSVDAVGYLPSTFPNRGYARLNGEAVTPETTPPGIPVGQEAYGIRAGNPPHQEPGKPQGWKGSLQEPRGARAGIAEGAETMAGSWLQWEREIARDNTRNLLQGFIEANWLLGSQPIYAASADRRCMHLSRALAYGWAWRNDDKPFKVFGLLCELDQPGEWHYDTLTRRLFLYPPGPLTETTAIALPVAQGFIRLDGTSHMSILGLDVQNVGGGTVYRIEAGQDNLVAGCTIRGSTATGLRITGARNGARGCDLIDLDVHVLLQGGQRSPSEISPGHNSVENCHLYQKGFKHQKVNVGISGVGNRFRHNLVHNSLGQAVTVSGNDHLLEFNEFFNIGYEEGDGGAVYAGADLAGYGTAYRYNFFHHLMHVPGKVERSGIHLDDLQAGATCIGNVFYKSAGKGIFMNGGAGHTLVGNLFLEGYRGIYNTGHGGQKNHDRQLAILADSGHMYQNTKENYVGRTESVVGPEGWTQSPWREKYPLFHQVMSDTGQYGRMWPIRCRVEDNLYYGNTRENRTTWSRCPPEVMAKVVIKNDRTVAPDDFVDYERLDLRFKQARTPSIPFEDIGLTLDEYRNAMPDKAHYRSTIKTFYAGIGSMPGTTNQIDTAQVVEQGPVIRRSNAPAAASGQDGIAAPVHPL